MRKRSTFVAALLCFSLGILVTKFAADGSVSSEEEKSVLRTMAEFHEVLRRAEHASLGRFLSDEVHMKSRFENSRVSRADLIDRISSNGFEVISVEVNLLSCETAESDASVKFLETVTVEMPGGDRPTQIAERRYQLEKHGYSWRIVGIEQLRFWSGGSG